MNPPFKQDPMYVAVAYALYAYGQALKRMRDEAIALPQPDAKTPA